MLTKQSQKCCLLLLCLLLAWHLPISFLEILHSCSPPLQVQILTDTICPYLKSSLSRIRHSYFSLSAGLQIFPISLYVLVTFLLCKLFLQPDFGCHRSSRLSTRLLSSPLLTFSSFPPIPSTPVPHDRLLLISQISALMSFKEGFSW